MNGDAADELVRMMLNGTEVAIRLTGSAAKNLAALLIAWSKNEKQVYGKTTMMKLLKSGEELQVLPLTKEQYRQFRSMAKKKVLYAPFLNTKSKDDKVDVVISSKSIPLVNHILKRIGYGSVEQAQEQPEESKKKDTPSSRSSTAVEDRPAASKEDSSRQEKTKPSVRERLESNRRLIEQREKEAPQKSRSKDKAKTPNKDKSSLQIKSQG